MDNTYDAKVRTTAERIYFFRRFNLLDGEEETDYALAQEYHSLLEKEPSYSFKAFCEVMFGDELEEARRRNEDL